MGMFTDRQKNFSLVALSRKWLKKVLVTKSPQTTIQDLPNELLVQICRQLSSSDRHSIGRVCRRFSCLIDVLGYISTDTAEVHVDFETQVLLVVGKNKTSCSVCLNGDLPYNKKLNLGNRSTLLAVFPSNMYNVVRNVGDSWMELVGIYLQRMNREFANIRIFKVLFVLPSEISSYIPYLLKLRDIKFDRLIICRSRRKNEPVHLPTELFPLLLNSMICLIGYYIPLQTICEFRIERIHTCLHATEAVCLIQQLMKGTFSMKAVLCSLSIKGDFQLLLNEALPHEVAVDTVESTKLYLPYVLQPDGHRYCIVISRCEGNMTIFRKNC